MSNIQTKEHLELIRARCVELLEIASKRTSGEWKIDGWKDCVNMGEGEEEICIGHISNAAFIAACAGAAEAGWKATIAAIDTLEKVCTFNALMESLNPSMGMVASYMETNEAINSILSAWPLELLKKGDR